VGDLSPAFVANMLIVPATLPGQRWGIARDEFSGKD
jgi:hypothetical protein